MMKAAGPIVSSSIADSMPPWMKPDGLQNSGLPSKPILITPSSGFRSISRQPSSFEIGGMLRLSNMLVGKGLVIGNVLIEAVAQYSKSRKILAVALSLRIQSVHQDLAHAVWQRLI